jgi:catechol 2,3-dioxygenase-like lactoylglutathione lyase family enzyme
MMEQPKKGKPQITPAEPEKAGSRRDPEERPIDESSEDEVREKTLDKTLADSFPPATHRPRSPIPPRTIPRPPKSRMRAQREVHAMAKAKAKSTPKKKAATKKTAAAPKRAAAKAKKPAAKVAATPAPAPAPSGDKLTFNHAMIYAKDVQRSVAFYRDMLGFKLIDEFSHDGILLYARLRAPGGDGTIALHLAGPGTSITSDGVRLYFEVRDVDGFCRTLQAKGLYIPQMPRMMPWGWRHVYINDPDGHEISLYWAGEMRMQKTVMKAARQVEKTPEAKPR